MINYLKHYFNYKMELQRLEIDGKNGLRFLVENKRKWFLVSDIKDVMETKTLPAMMVKNIEDEEKGIFSVNIDTQQRPLLFVTENAAYNIVLRSRGKKSAEIKEKLLKLLNGKKKLNLRPRKNKNEDKKVDVESDNEPVEDVDEEEILRDRKVTSPIKFPTDKKAVVPHNEFGSFNQYTNIHPETARMVVELEKYRIDAEKDNKDKDRELELKRLEVQRQKYISDENIKTINYYRDLNRKILTSNWIGTVERERILEHQKTVEEFVLNKIGRGNQDRELYEKERDNPYGPYETYDD